MALKAMTVDLGIEGLMPRINKWINDEHKEKPSVYKQFMEEVTTDQFFLEEQRDGGFSDFPMLDEGDDMNFGLPDTGDKVRIQPEMRQLAFAITRLDKKYNRTNKVQRYSKKLRAAAMRTIEKVAVLPLNLAADTGTMMVDGQPLLSTAHVRVNGQLTANTPTVQTDLTIDALEAAVTAFGATVGEDGGVISMVPKFLVVGNANMINGMRLLNSTNYFVGTGTGTNPPTATNADTGVYNVIKTMGLTLIVDNYLTDPDAWFLMADKDENNYKMVWNEKMRPRGFDDQFTEDSVYSLSFSCIAAITSDLGIYGSVGA